MKKAFTMIEIVFVIIIIGIITAIAIPKLNNDNLQTAADQVISHIRYTQHLAMQDDKFNINDTQWFKGRWTIRFYKDLSFTGSYIPTKNYSNIWAYTIYSDKKNYSGNNPDVVGIAKNPENKEQLLTGGYNNTVHVEDPKSMEELRLNIKYGITDIKFSNGCRSNTTYISFDNIGRPFNTRPRTYPYEVGTPGWHKLLTKKCIISLYNKSDKIDIAIEPETGYVHIEK